VYLRPDGGLNKKMKVKTPVEITAIDMAAALGKDPSKPRMDLPIFTVRLPRGDERDVLLQTLS